ncbi:sulfotransferase [Reichenbachiella agarivorans]|uniref:Sulfotransferase n=1 Tax=Reichenbachiella agarivorans TaxID=2979464 RepID=A0ABY6CQY7_9BACT|nr:sulfotransferase [Reichenbachiella agarivorans]UXP32932.1 sulfotransferase [Reichenbachiella agarivorans]
MLIKHRVQDYFNLFKHTALGVSFHTWIKILIHHRLAVGWQFIPKALFITMTSLVNAPFQLVEYFVYHKKIKSTAVKRPIFILGHPRSGTTYLHYLISADPNFAFCTTSDALIPHLILTTGKITAKILDAFMPGTRPQDNVKAGAKMPKEEEFAMANISTSSFMHGFYFPQHLQQVFDRDVVFASGDPKVKTIWKRDFHYFVQKLTYKNKGKQLVLKSPANTARLQEIYELYPDALFIHIHRDPYEVFQSNVVLYAKVLPILNLHKTTTEAIETFIIDSFAQLYTKYLEDIKLIPNGQIIEVDYASFVANSMTQLELIYQHLGLGDFQHVKAALQQEVKQFDGYQKNKHVQLPEAIIQQIHDKWGFYMERYGY